MFFVLLPQPSLIRPSDNQLSLADFDAVKVIGKGNGGIVRLVPHKWTGQFFALKVLYNLGLKFVYSFIPFLEKRNATIKKKFMSCLQLRICVETHGSVLEPHHDGYICALSLFSCVLAHHSC